MSNLKNELSRVTTLDELLAVFDKYTTPVAKAVNEALAQINYGATKEYRVSIARSRREANAKAIEIIERVKGNPNLLTDDERQALAQYTGNGGIGGSIDEYYTPQWLAEGTWDQLKAYGFSGGNVLEPSAGTGVFLGTKPAGTLISATEISPVSSQVNQLLHPDDLVENVPFERLAVRVEDNTYDAVVGNVPFGDVRKTRNIDEAYKDIKFLDEYFVERTIDKVKAGGLITLICPTRTVSGRNMQALRERISRKAEFLGAHRIPSGTFSNSGSASVVTDVLVMRKFPEDIADKLHDLSDDVLDSANVLWDTFITGKWFDTVGKKYVHGDIKKVTNAQGELVDTVVVPNLPTGTSKAAQEAKAGEINAFNAGIKAKLARPFKSRIDWDLLESSEPKQVIYSEGDSKFINGRQHTFENGVWVQTQLEGMKDGSLDIATYGASNLSDVAYNINNPEQLLTLTHDQIMAVYNNMRDLVDDETQASIRLAATSGLSPQEQYRIIRGCAIGRKVQIYQDAVSVSPIDAQYMLPALQKLVGDEFDKYGAASSHKAFKKLTGNMSREFFMFANGTDKEGTLSDLLQGEIDRTALKQFDPDSPESVVNHLFSQVNLTPVTLAAFREYCTDPFITDLNDKSLKAYLSRFDGIAISKSGELVPWDRAISGYITERVADLTMALTYETDNDIRDNYSRQIDDINRKRTWNDTDSITFSMRSKWIPRSYILDFLRQNGFDELSFSTIQKDDEGNLVDTEDLTNPNGQFTGYYNKNGKRVPSKPENRLARQLEKYLNGDNVAGKDAALLRDQIRLFEERFSRWIKIHEDNKELTQLYNDAFNNHIPFQHSNSDLELSNVSGSVTLKGYQNEAIRRLSEDGRGILGFDTGLGKTLTALGLVQYNVENGRSRRTAIVVPKAVYHNWFNECAKFYGKEHLSKMFFPALEPVTSKDGDFIYDPVLNEQGEQVINKNTGKPETTIRIKEFKGKELTARINSIPHSNYQICVITKEVFQQIPLKESTIDDIAYGKLGAAVNAGKIEAVADNYTQEKKRSRFLDKAKDTGGKKASEYAYFEDMAFDSIIADEGHMYRNSIKVSNEASRLAYLSTSKEAQLAVDLRQKSAYLNKKFGRGTVLLTATPTVNSPLDIYNMLSHIMREDEWINMGILEQDDFLNMFGETKEMTINKISGDTYDKQALIGFKNLTALRSLFHRFANIQDANTVKADVVIPDTVPVRTHVELTQEQKDLYEHLRFRAEVASLARRDELHTLSIDDQIRAEAILEQYPEDQTFAIIRDMDRVTNDIDLYNRTITYLFKQEDKGNVDKLLAALPQELKFSKTIQRDKKKIKQEWSIPLNLKAKLTDDCYRVSVSQEYEDLVAASFSKFGLDESTISHPVPPKTAAMLEKLKAAIDAGGKCIIFTEEKMTHRRLHRLVCNYVGLRKEQVGIINGDTVTGKTSPINESVTSKDIKGSDAKKQELADKGIEAIASKYNSGKMLVIIANKKAEVGINLHKGTTDVFHLSLPWTSASLDQRDGRAARVGSTQSSVNSHTFDANGSFDSFRLETINRKRKWIQELFNGDEETALNEDAQDEAEQALLLARNPEEAQRQLALIKAQEDKVKREKARVLALVDVEAYIDAKHASQQDIAKLSDKVTDIQVQIEKAIDSSNRTMAEIKASEREIEEINKGVYTGQSSKPMIEARIKMARKEWNKKSKVVSGHKSDLKKVQTLIDKQKKAINTINRVKPLIERSISDGLLIGNEANVLTNSSDFMVYKGVMYAVGDQYLRRYEDSTSIVFEIVSVNPSAKTFEFRMLGHTSKGTMDLNNIADDLEKVSYTPSETETIEALSSIDLSRISATVNEADYRKYIKQGLVRTRQSLFNAIGDTYELIEDRYIDPSYADTVIYPDPANTRLRKKVAAFGAKMLEQGGDINWSYRDCFKAVLGDDWQALISESGNKADPDTISNYFAAELEKIQSDQYYSIERNNVVEGSTSVSILVNDIRSKLLLAVPDGYTNKDEFTQYAKNLADSIGNTLEAEKLAAGVRQENENAAKFAQYRSQPVSQIKERLSALLDVINSVDGKIFRFAIKLRSEPSLSMYKDDPAMFLADLATIGAFPQFINDKLMINKNALMKIAFDRETSNGAIKTLLRDWDNEDNVISRYLNAEQEQQTFESNLSDVEPSEMVVPKKEVDLFAAKDAKITKNTGIVPQKVGRKKVKHEPYSLIAVQQNNGSREPRNTQEIEKLGGFNAVDVSPEYPNWWSFFPANTDDETIFTTLYGLSDYLDALNLDFAPYQKINAQLYEQLESWFTKDELQLSNLISLLISNDKFINAINAPDWEKRDSTKATVNTVVRRAMKKVRPNWDVPDSFYASVIMAIVLGQDEMQATKVEEPEQASINPAYKADMMEWLDNATNPIIAGGERREKFKMALTDFIDMPEIQKALSGNIWHKMNDIHADMKKELRQVIREYTKLAGTDLLRSKITDKIFDVLLNTATELAK